MLIILKFSHIKRHSKSLLGIALLAQLVMSTDCLAESETNTPSNPVAQSQLTPEQLELRAEMDALRASELGDAQPLPLPEIEMVNLTGGISMGKYEVTQAQWQAVMGNNPAQFASCGERCPIETISWNEVQTFLQKLNSRSGKQYRLPTEQEWLAACKAGKENQYCGTEDLNAIAWYASNAQDKAHPVGQKHANAWGLHDMSGNVSEWTKTCQDSACLNRVICGGSWLNSASLLKVTARDWQKGGLRNSRLGFRLVLDR